MLYMIIENFHPEKGKQLYARLEEKGRQLPAGVTYMDSWIDTGLTTCFQLMESEELSAIQAWVQLWNDLADFSIIPVISSSEAREKARDA